MRSLLPLLLLLASCGTAEPDPAPPEVLEEVNAVLSRCRSDNREWLEAETRLDPGSGRVVIAGPAEGQAGAQPTGFPKGPPTYEYIDPIGNTTITLFDPDGPGRRQRRVVPRRDYELCRAYLTGQYEGRRDALQQAARR